MASERMNGKYLFFRDKIPGLIFRSSFEFIRVFIAKLKKFEKNSMKLACSDEFEFVS